ncbi:response regulator [Bradyrhizobium sp. 6(2017)]|uniref:response regulator n=1 Tax=Bradyrhizobium sp. 6(2017) TaxID=1197460 RepID=UPI0013E15DE7|nr:response regulator [Bradyrhizobium sp. 6(2017)]QIG96794.1 response regulator [Bradyrhizobium sp. 6(2017)]
MTGPAYSVFVVEDEAMIRMMLVEMLEELGHTVAAEAGHLEQAVHLANSSEFDFAVLDINLAGKSSSPVAEIIRTRKLPFIFSTGYGASGIPPDFADVRSLQKPFTIEALGRTVDELMRGVNPFGR